MSLDTFDAMHAADAASRLADIATYRRDSAAKRAAGNTSMASFYELLADQAQQRHDRITPALSHVGTIGIGATLRNERHAQWASMFPDASVPGSFRYQLYDERGFFSHGTHPSLFAAALEAATQGFTIPDDEAPARVMAQPSFERETRLAALVQQVNAGTMSHAQAHIEAERINAEYAPPTAAA